MKLTNNDDIERHLKNAAEALAPGDDAEAGRLWRTPVAKASGDEWYLEGLTGAAKTEKKRRPVFRYMTMMTAMAALLVVVIFALPMRQVLPSATIYMDVNPSLTIEVDKNEKVIDVIADNADGDTILEDMDLKKVDIDVAINALIGSMVKNGYLTEAKNFILLTVEGDDPEKAEALRLRLETSIDQSMQSMVGSAAVFDQVAEINDTEVDLAEQYGISPGKALLIEKLVETNPQLSYEMLAGLSIEELYNQLKAEGIDLRSYLNYHGIDLDADDDPLEELIDELEEESDDDIDDPDDDDDDIYDQDDDDDNDIDDADDDIDDDIDDVYEDVNDDNDIDDADNDRYDDADDYDDRVDDDHDEADDDDGDDDRSDDDDDDGDDDDDD